MQYRIRKYHLWREIVDLSIILGQSTYYYNAPLELNQVCRLWNIMQVLFSSQQIFCLSAIFSIFEMSNQDFQNI